MKNTESPKKNRPLIPNLQKASQVLTFLSQHEEALKRETEAIIKQSFSVDDEVFVEGVRYLAAPYLAQRKKW